MPGPKRPEMLELPLGTPRLGRSQEVAVSGTVQEFQTTPIWGGKTLPGSHRLWFLSLGLPGS